MYETLSWVIEPWLLLPITHKHLYLWSNHYTKGVWWYRYSIVAYLESWTYDGPDFEQANSQKIKIKIQTSPCKISKMFYCYPSCFIFIFFFLRKSCFIYLFFIIGWKGEKSNQVNDMVLILHIFFFLSIFKKGIVNY